VRLCSDILLPNRTLEKMQSNEIFSKINIFGYEFDDTKKSEIELFQLYAEGISLSSLTQNPNYSLKDCLNAMSSDESWSSLAEIVLDMESINDVDQLKPKGIRAPKERSEFGSFIQAMNKTFSLGLTRDDAHWKDHEIIMIHNIAINKNHSMSKSICMQKVIDIMLASKNIHGKPDLSIIVFQAYPLQYMSKKETRALKGYGLRKANGLMNDTKKLMHYYKSLGYKCMIMNNPDHEEAQVEAPWLGRAILN
jgi:hypothetical protein